MPLILDCPKCTRKLRVPDGMFGTRVQCPSCGTAFDAENVPAPPPMPVPGLEPAPLPEAHTNLRLEDEGPARKSPHGEPRKSTASKRARDDEDEDDEDRPWEGRRVGVRRDCEPHRGGTVLALGIISIVLSFTGILAVVGLALGIPAWVMGQRDLRKMKAREMDPEGMGTTQGGWICGIIGTILSSLFTLGCIGYLVLIAFVVSSAAKMPPPGPVQQPAPKMIPNGPPQPVVPKKMNMRMEFSPLGLRESLPKHRP